MAPLQESSPAPASPPAGRAHLPREKTGPPHDHCSAAPVPGLEEKCHGFPPLTLVTKTQGQGDYHLTSFPRKQHVNLFSTTPFHRLNTTVPRRNANHQVFTYTSVQLTFASSGGFTGTFLLCKSKREKPVFGTVLYGMIHSYRVHRRKLKQPIQSCWGCPRGIHTTL